MKRIKILFRITSLVLVCTLFSSDVANRWMFGNQMSVVRAAEDIPEISEDMYSKAEELGTALNIYNYLRNNINTEYYPDRRKGSEATFDSKGGNDIDQAILLSDMLRTLGYETRFVTGVIRLSEQNALDYTLSETIEDAARILGLENEVTIVIDETSASKVIETEHTWIEAYLPYTDYRGSGNNEGDYVWVPLDTSFKKYKEVSSVCDYEYDQLEDLINAGEEIYFTDKIVEEQNLEYLPLSLQYSVKEVRNITEDADTFEEDNICLSYNGKYLMSLTYKELYCKRLTISYEGEGSLTPLIKLDGEIIAKGDLTVFGNEDILEIEVNSGNEAHLIHNKIKAGGIYQITCDAQTITPRELDGSLENFREAQQTISEFNVLEEDKVGSMLDLAGKLYFAMLDVQNRVTAAKCEVNTSRTLSVGMMGYCPVGVDENGGGFLFTDIDYDSYNVAESGENAKLFMLMSGMTSSAYESAIWELFTGIPSVSTMSVFEAAYEGEIEGVVLTKNNFEEKRSSLKVADSVIANIEKEIQADKLVILPNETIHMLDWQGSAYIALDCETMAGGYIIDGGFHNVSLNGGSSSVTWTKESIANMILLVVDIYEIVTMVSAATALLALGPIGTVLFAGVVILAVAMLVGSVLTFDHNHDLIMRYYGGDESVGEELYGGLLGAAGLNLLFTIGGGAVQGSVLKFAKNTLAKEAGEVLAGKLVARFDDAGDAYKVYKNLKNANVGSLAIEELVDCLEKESLRKLSTLAARQLPGNILEALGRNVDVLDNISISDALAFKNAVSSGEDIVRLFREHGSGFVTAFKCYGDDAVEILLTHGDNALDDLMEYGLDFIGLHRTQGENFARLYAKFGSTLLDQYRIYQSSLFTNIARHGDDYVEYVIRYGDDFVRGADKYHDYFLIGIRTYDDVFMNMYREEGDEFVERFIKDGCEIVENSGEIDAWKAIDEYRSITDGLEPLGDTIPTRGDNNGTVAFVDVNGNKVFGLNSSLLSDTDKDLGKKYFTEMKLAGYFENVDVYGRGSGQVFTHAEGYSLMKAYSIYGDDIGKNVTIYCDRATCGICQNNLQYFKEYFGLEKLTVKNKNGNIFEY